jgi:Cu-Zn family superoxide dismutase
MQRVQIMVKTRYNRLLPLLVLAAGCQPEEPEQPEPQAGRTSTEAAQPDAGRQSQGSAEQEPTAQRVALAEISATEGREATGTLQFTAEGDTVRVQGRITGLEPGAHGLHIHAKGDCSAPDASTAGDHYSPDDDPHGSPLDLPDAHHVGDLGNVFADDQGIADVAAEDTEMRLNGPESIVGKAVIVHEGRDDLESQPTGDSGARVGCGVIRMEAQAMATGQAPATAMTHGESAGHARDEGAD